MKDKATSIMKTLNIKNVHRPIPSSIKGPVIPTAIVAIQDEATP